MQIRSLNITQGCPTLEGALHRARGHKMTMQRVDSGPTVNPDVPDERTAWKMEVADLEQSITKAKADAQTAEREAAEYWQKHQEARALGRISSWNIEAQKAESRARSYGETARTSGIRLAELQQKLGLK